MLLLLPLLACSPGSGDLQALLDAAVDDGLPGASAAIRTPAGALEAHAGLAVRDPAEEWGEEHVFRVASNSKTFLGVLAAQLAAEGELDLDQPLSSWLDEEVLGDIDNAEEVTLRQCLNHTSGLYDYLGNDEFWWDAEDDPELGFTTEEALMYAEGEDASFAPGTDWEYSNTNYLLAGLVLDEVTGEHHHVAFRERIYSPLDLELTSYEGEESARGPLVHGYADYWADGEDIDSTEFDHGYGLADGGLLSTAGELALFIEAVGTGSALLDEASRTEMFGQAADAGGGESYGLGVSVLQDDHGEVIFHGGGLVGYTSEMTTWPDAGVTLVLLVNGSDATAYDDGFDDLLAEVEALAHAP